MLRIERKLRTWLTNGLCGDNTNWFMISDWFTSGHVDTVSLASYTIVTFGSENALNLNAINFIVSFELSGNFWRDELICLKAIFLNSLSGITTSNAHSKTNTGSFAFRFIDAEAWIWSFTLDRKDVLRYIDETASEITRVGSTESRRHLTLASTTSCDEGLESVETFLIARLDWELNFAVGYINHDTDHRRCKLNVTSRATSARVGHDRNVSIEVGEVILNVRRNLIVNFTPSGDSEAITLIFGNESIIELLRDKGSFAFTFSNHRFNFWVIWIVVL